MVSRRHFIERVGKGTLGAAFVSSGVLFSCEDIPKKIRIDPNNVLGSIVAGPQQFTVIGDTHHGNPDVFGYVVDHMEVMAQCGVKHLILEASIPSYEDVEAVNPYLSLYDTREDKLRALEDAAAVSSSVISEIMEDFNEAYMDYLPIELESYYSAVRGIQAYKEREFLERINSFDRPLSKENKEEIRLFCLKNIRIMNVPPERRDEMSLHYARALSKAHELGLQIHFTGNIRRMIGAEIASGLLQAADMQIEASKALLNDIGKMESELKASEILHSARKKLKYFDILVEKSKKWKEADGIVNIHPEIEEARVSDFIRLVRREKAVVFWGQGHVWKDRDFNEFLDEKLRNKFRFGRYHPVKTLDVYMSKAVLRDRERLYAKEAKKMRHKAVEKMGHKAQVTYFIKDRAFEISEEGRKYFEDAGVPAPSNDYCRDLN